MGFHVEAGAGEQAQAALVAEAKPAGDEAMRRVLGRQMRHLLIQIADHQRRADRDARDRLAEFPGRTGRPEQQADQHRLADPNGPEPHDPVLLEFGGDGGRRKAARALPSTRQRPGASGHPSATRFAELPPRRLVLRGGPGSARMMLVVGRHAPLRASMFKAAPA